MAEQPSYSVPLQQGAPWLLEGTQPAAGANYAIANTDKDHRRLQIDALRFTLTTDANVATRRVNIQWTNGSSWLLENEMSQTQTASLTYNYYLLPNNTRTSSLIGTKVYASIPENIIIDRDIFGLSIIITNIQAGDQLSNIKFHCRFWAERTQ